MHFNLQLSLLDWNHYIKHSEGRQPDGVTLVPWQQGKCLTWDVTWPDDTFAPCIGQAAVDSGLVASAAEEWKRLKYRELPKWGYLFIPVAVETWGVFGLETRSFFKELGHHVARVSGDKSAFIFLIQRISVAVQRGLAASILGSVPEDNLSLL